MNKLGRRIFLIVHNLPWNTWTDFQTRPFDSIKINWTAYEAEQLVLRGIGKK